jgi:molecular chaperone DnaK (HSP70)
LYYRETTYSPEELLGMVLEKAKEYAEAFTGNLCHTNIA